MRNAWDRVTGAMLSRRASAAGEPASADRGRSLSASRSRRLGAVPPSHRLTRRIRVVRAYHPSEGDFSPLGLDAMRHRVPGGAVRTRCLQDINARWTMGRLALGLRRFPHLLPLTDGVFRPGELVGTLAPRPARTLCEA